MHVFINRSVARVAASIDNKRLTRLGPCLAAPRTRQALARARMEIVPKKRAREVEEEQTDDEAAYAPAETLDAIVERVTARELLQDARRNDAQYRGLVRAEYRAAFRVDEDDRLDPQSTRTCFFPLAEYRAPAPTLLPPAMTRQYYECRRPWVAHALLRQERVAVEQRVDPEGGLAERVRACRAVERALRPLAEATEQTRSAAFETVLAYNANTEATLWGGCSLPSAMALEDVKAHVDLPACVFQVWHALTAAVAAGGTLRRLRDIRLVHVGQTNLAERDWLYTVKDKYYCLPPARHCNLQVRIRLRVPDDDGEDPTAAGDTNRDRDEVVSAYLGGAPGGAGNAEAHWAEQGFYDAKVVPPQELNGRQVYLGLL